MDEIMNRRDFIKAVGVGAAIAPISLASISSESNKSPKGKPNIIIGSNGIQPYCLCSTLLRQILHAPYNTDSTFTAMRPSPA